MYSLAQAKLLASRYAEDTGEEWAIFKTPEDAPCNQYPANVHNQGRFMVCKASERAEYEEGGAEFI